MRTLTRLMLIASLIMATSETVYGQNDWDSLLTVGVSDTLFGISIVQDSLIRIAGVQGVISSNGGSTWATEAALDSMDDVFFVNPDTGFAIGSSGDLRTTTGPSGLTTTAGGSSFTTGTPRVWAFNPDTAIITSQFVEFINITNDGGASTWSNVSPESIMAYNLVFVDSVGWAVGDSGRIWKSTNTGFNWTGQTSGTSQPLLGVSFLDTLRGWAVGDSGTTFFTIDGGTTWNFAGSSVTQALRGVTFVDSLTGWAVGDSGTVVHSADGGITWLQDNSGITSDLWDIGFNSSSIMAVGELGTVLMLNWPPDTILVGDADLDSSVTAVDASLILQHKVRKYTLTGTAFTAADVTGNGTISAYDASYVLQQVVGSISTFPAGDTFLARSGKSKRAVPDIQQTIQSDGSITVTVAVSNVTAYSAADLHIEFDKSAWTYLGYTLPEVLTGFQVEAAQENDLLRIAMASPIDLTFDGELVHLHFRRSANASAGAAIRLTELYLDELQVLGPANTLATETLPITWELSSNYPNPFNPSTTVQYQIPEDAHVSIGVYNMLGQKIAVLVDEQYVAGYYTALWDGRNAAGLRVASGVYFLRMQANQFVRTRKMLLLQ